MNNIIQKTAFLAGHFFFRKILIPMRRRKWQTLHASFEHKAAKGLRFILKPGEYVDSYIYTEGIYERRFLRFIDQKLQSKRTMLDIGANIGNHSIYLSSSFEVIHAFDPNPEAVRRLQQNIAVNEIKNIVVHKVGLSEFKSTLPFMVSTDGNLGTSRILDQPTEQSILVETVRGDEYLLDLGINHIDFIKIDVEGFELDAMKGLVETIERHRPIVAFEYHAHDFNPGHFDEFRKILSGYVFVELVFAAANAGNLEKLAFNFSYRGTPKIIQIEDLEARTYENILAIPSMDALSDILAESGQTTHTRLAN